MKGNLKRMMAILAAASLVIAVLVKSGAGRIGVEQTAPRVRIGVQVAPLIGPTPGVQQRPATWDVIPDLSMARVGHSSIKLAMPAQVSTSTTAVTDYPSAAISASLTAKLPTVAAEIAMGMVSDRLNFGLVGDSMPLPTRVAAPAQQPARTSYPTPISKAKKTAARPSGLHPGPAATATMPAKTLKVGSDYQVMRSPSISAKTIDAVLEAYHSPSFGHGQQFYDLGVKYGVDPAFMLAFYLKESTLGTAGAVVLTKNIGNIICTREWTDAGGLCAGRWRVYPSDIAGAEDWYQLISGEGFAGQGLVTVEQIVPKYAPAGDCNGAMTICNNPAEYIHDVETSVAWFRWLEQVSK